MNKSRLYWSGFSVALLLFLGINLLAAHLMSDCGLAAVIQMDRCADDIVRIGWPFKFYEQGGFAYRFEFNTFSLWMDIGIGLALSTAVGWWNAARTE